MGLFAEPVEMRGMTKIPELLELTDDQLDELYIIPAERMIEARYNLLLNTDSEPTHWAGRFDSVPAEKTKFNNDYKRCIFILVNFIASNPYNLADQSIAGSSATFSKQFPYLIDSMMEKWSRSSIIRRA